MGEQLNSGKHYVRSKRYNRKRRSPEQIRREALTAMARTKAARDKREAKIAADLKAYRDFAERVRKGIDAASKRNDRGPGKALR